MTHWCILVADGSRARLLTATFPSAASSAQLEERELLLNPERNLSGREIFSNVKSGRNRASARSAAHGYDDHRLRHRDEVERRFARRVASAASRLVHSARADWFVVVAEPRLLGMLRAPLDRRLPSSTARSELAEDLSWHTLTRIRSLLEDKGVLPKSQPSLATWRPRVQPPPKPPEQIVPPTPRSTPHTTARPRRGRAKLR